MDFDFLTDNDLKQIEQELAQYSSEAGLQLSDIEATLDTGLGTTLEITATQLDDLYLAHSGNADHRRNRYLVRIFAVAGDDETREVIWGRIEYSVHRSLSNFWPVPEKYGDYVTITFGWEFDRETLEHNVAELRDCEQVHYASVLPNEQFVEFIECCSAIAERWAERAE